MSPARTADPLQAPARPARLEAFLSYGFRPFFLGASVYGALVMAVWLLWIVDGLAGNPVPWLPVAGTPIAWHAHEMLFGFVMAAIAGFLLTAVPNWTGALPIAGAPLAALFGLWLAGRVAMWTSGFTPPVVVAPLDIAFVPALGAFATRQLLVKPAARNLVFLLFLGVITVANGAYHLGTAGIGAIDPMATLRIVLLVVALMITIIGGRIVPAFTHNWLHQNAPNGPMPRRAGWLDTSAVLAMALLLLLEAAGTPGLVKGAVAAMAATLHGARLLLWRGWTTGREPIVWVLHLAYAWVVVGLVLTALSYLGGVVPLSVASHAFGSGAAGTMIMAVMSRASLGHTGRPLVAPAPIVLAYGLVTLAALLRVAGPVLAPTHTIALLVVAALAWIAAFATFAAVYAPILTSPHVRMKRP